MKFSKNNLIILIIALLISLIMFRTVNTNLTPERSREQKIFDDYLANLNSIYKDYSSHMNSETLQDNSLHPSFELQYSGASSSEITFKLNWSDIQNVKKGLRVLELLSLANIFSDKDVRQQEDQILITTSTGYKFKAAFSSQDLKNNSSLTLALVLLKNNS